MFHLHVPNMVSRTRCQAIVEQVDRLGFAPAKVNHYGKLESLSRIRNNERLELRDEVLAAELAGLLVAACGAQFPSRMDGHPYANVGAAFRAYRYLPGQYFKPHRDGDVRVGDSVSRVTVLLYLNDADGGETVLMPEGFARKDAWITVQPRVGDVLMFEHACWHEGRPVNRGEKYVLRTDCFYRDGA